MKRATATGGNISGRSGGNEANAPSPEDHLVLDNKDSIKPPRMLVANPNWSVGLILAACLVGFSLLVVGLWGELSVSLDGIVSLTFMVSGLALIFGAFGAQATVQYKGWVVAGVAAIALAFLFSIDYLRRDSYVVVELVTSKKPTTTLDAGNTIVKGTVKVIGETQRTRFIVLYGELGRDVLPYFVVEGLSSSAQQVCFKREKLIRWFGRNSQLNWTLDETAMQVSDFGRNLIGTLEDCYPTGLPAISPRADLFIPSAFAQTAPADITPLIRDLLSDNTDVRRLTRERLADLGPLAIRPVMDQANRMTTENNRSAFRMQIGAAVSISNMIYRKSGSFPVSAVRAQLNDADFESIVQWSLNDDVSLRVPAASILAGTAELPVLENLLRKTEEQADENVFYNTAWILRQSAQRYGTDRTTLTAIRQLADRLREKRPGPKTIRFLDQISEGP